MYVEDHINAMRQQKSETPFGWLICFEGRPLQGIPPKGNGPHILFFSEESKAQAFIAGRKAFFGEEPLSVVSVDSPDTLQSLAISPSSDSRYAAPPCGILLDFDYTTTKSRKILAPAEVSSLLPAEIARKFGFGSSQVAASISEPPKPAPPMAPTSPARKKRTLVTVLITCGILLVVGLFLLGIGGAWLAMRRGLIPALPFLNTPTQTRLPTKTPLPTATPAPTATAVSTATEVVWEINVEDVFSSNVNGWPVGFDKGQYGSSNLSIQNGKLVSEVTSVNDCWYWWYPDLPTVSDFDASMDIQRTEGSITGDYGMVVRLDGDQNSFYYFAINDTNQEYAFFLYQNDNWTRIQDWTFSSSIGSGKINRIGVNARGSRFVFSINGTEVGSTNNARLASGQVGILAKLYDSADNIIVEYDNLVLQGNR